jgi:hypothetical protein
MEGSGTIYVSRNPSLFLVPHSLHTFANRTAYDEFLEEMETAEHISPASGSASTKCAAELQADVQECRKPKGPLTLFGQQIIMTMHISSFSIPLLGWTTTLATQCLALPAICCLAVC